jgi:hypothetical protein
MTPQHQANAALQAWQILRALPPDERIEVLMATFWMSPLESLTEYDSTLRNVAAEMEDAS